MGVRADTIPHGPVYIANINTIDLGIENVGFSIDIDGGGLVLAAGVKTYWEIPMNCTINSWTLLANVSGSIVIDLWQDTYANFPPTVADTITASAKPTISSATKGTSSTLTGWTVALTKGKILAVNIDSCTTITKCILSLSLTR